LWSKSNNNISYTNGYIGVGTSNIPSLLSLLNPGGSGGIYFEAGKTSDGNNAGWHAINFNGYFNGIEQRINTNKSRWRVVVDQRNTTDNFFIEKWSGSGFNCISINSSGNVSFAGSISPASYVGLPVASTSVQGIVQLTDSISTNSNTAATPNSVKSVNDIAVAVSNNTFNTSNNIYPIVTAASNNTFNTSNNIYPVVTAVSNNAFLWTKTGVNTYYTAGNVSIGTSTATEKLDVQAGNVKFGCNLYVMSNLGIGKSNPSYTVDVTGDINFSGTLYKGGVIFSSGGGSYWTSNTQGIYYNFANCNVGIGTSVLTEKFEVQSGNSKFGCNVYVMSNLGIGKSNPTFSLDVLGASYVSGTMIQNGEATFCNAITGLGALAVNGAVSLSNTLGVSNVATFTSNVAIAGLLRLYNSNNNQQCTVATATVSGQYSTSSSSNDLIIRCDNTTAKVLIQSGSGAAALVINSNNTVGINKINPSYTLDVGGTVNATGLYVNGVPYVSGGGGSGGSSQWSNNSSNVFILSSNVGIGLSNPIAPLDVNGTLSVRGNLSVQNFISMTGVGIMKRTSTPANMTVFMPGILNNGSSVSISASNFVSIQNSNNTEYARFMFSNSVGYLKRYKQMVRFIQIHSFYQQVTTVLLFRLIRLKKIVILVCFMLLLVL
jgi:hypothetical protein